MSKGKGALFSRLSRCESRIKHKQGKRARASNHTLAAKTAANWDGVTQPRTRDSSAVRMRCYWRCESSKAIARTPVQRTLINWQRKAYKRLCTARHHRHCSQWWQRFEPRINVATAHRSPLLIIPGVRRLRVVLLLRGGNRRGGPPSIGGPRRGCGARARSSVGLPSRRPPGSLA